VAYSKHFPIIRLKVSAMEAVFRLKLESDISRLQLCDCGL